MKPAKKAIELPTSMIVILILSILTFSLGTAMVYKFFAKATETGTAIDKQTQEEIQAALSEEKNIIALPENTRRTTIGQKATFGIGIRNIGDAKKFVVSTAFEAAYLPNEEKITSTDANLIEKDWLGNFKYQETSLVKKDELYTTPITIRAGNYLAQGQLTKPGTYVFNVCVFECKQQPCTRTPCTPNAKDTTYGQTVRQINVIV